jgi:hypothetical protein
VLVRNNVEVVAGNLVSNTSPGKEYKVAAEGYYYTVIFDDKGKLLHLSKTAVKKFFKKCS